MSISLEDRQGICHMEFGGNMTVDCSRELEDKIIEALRRYSRFEVDLSRVERIDLCGLHLLQILESIGGKGVSIVASSGCVDRARQHLLASPRRSYLRSGGVPRERVAAG